MNMGGGMGEAPTEAEFEAAGIKHTYLKSTACAATAESPVTDLSAVEDDILSLGAVTGTRAKAKELVAGMKEKVDAVQRAVGGLPEDERPTYFFFDYDAGTKQPMAVCNRQIANAVITLAGARNVFADVPLSSAPTSLEAIAARSPRAVVVVGGSDGFVLRPEWRTLPAVREYRVLRLDHPVLARPSPRAPGAITAIRRRLDSALAAPSPQEISQ
jgi:ABC-type Fe3+-hydroxamate transport system substrate-binding protein